MKGKELLEKLLSLSEQELDKEIMIEDASDKGLLHPTSEIVIKGVIKIKPEPFDGL